MKIIALAFVFVLLAIPSAYALDASTLPSLWVCQPDGVLNITIDTQDTFISSNITCPFGCSDGLHRYGADCNPPPYEKNIYLLAIVIAIIIIGIVLIGRKR